MCAPARRGRGLERREMARSLQGNLTEWAALAVRRPWNDRPGHRFINPQPDARFGNLHEGEEFDVLFLVSGCDGPAMLGFRDETRDPVAAVGVAITRKRCRSARDRTGDSCCAKQGGFDCPNRTRALAKAFGREFIGGPSLSVCRSSGRRPTGRALFSDLGRSLRLCRRDSCPACLGSARWPGYVVMRTIARSSPGQRRQTR